MAHPNEFEIPASILAAAVIAKSDLTGFALQKYAADLQHSYVKQMIVQRQIYEGSDQSNK